MSSRRWWGPAASLQRPLVAAVTSGAPVWNECADREFEGALVTKQLGIKFTRMGKLLGSLGYVGHDRNDCYMCIAIKGPRPTCT
jgi:hypothetical protein